MANEDKLPPDFYTELFREDIDQGALIPRERVLNWMGSANIEVLGAAYVLILKPQHYNRITPPLTFDDYHTFVRHYHERCFLENPQGEWCNSRYEAGWNLANWFARLWRDQSVPRSALEELKTWLAKLYTATLEHLFETPELAEFFAEWKSDPILSVAHEAAMEWVRGGV
jgi:hypothetical protein